MYDKTVRTLPQRNGRTAQRPRSVRPEEKPPPPLSSSSSSSDVHRAAVAAAAAVSAYTGMDREIVEEFISVTMDPKRYG